MFKMENLENCFKSAKRTKAKYVAVMYENKEVIINPAKNFDQKLEYYKKAYDEDLTLKTFKEIKIAGFTFANSFKEIEKDLELS